MATKECMTKTQKAINLFKAQDLKGALRIFKGFDRQFTKQEIRTIQIAYEILTGKGSFYKQLHYDLGSFIAGSMSIIERKYNITY